MKLSPWNNTSDINAEPSCDLGNAMATSYRLLEGVDFEFFTITGALMVPLRFASLRPRDSYELHGDSYSNYSNTKVYL